MSSVPPPSPRSVVCVSDDEKEEQIEVLKRIETTLQVVLTAQLEFGMRLSRLEGPPAAPHAAPNYPPPVYQGPERRRETHPSYTSEAIVQLKEDTAKQTPILQSMAPRIDSMVPMVEGANRKQWYAIIAIVAQTLAIIAYALVQARAPIPH